MELIPNNDDNMPERLIWQEQKEAFDPATQKPIEMTLPQQFEVARLREVWEKMAPEQQKDYVTTLLKNYYIQMEAYKVIVKKKWGIA